MGRLVTISYTQLDASGGVPAFNRALHVAFPDRECIHFSWWDHPFHPELEGQGNLPEWQKSRLLNEYLVGRRLVRPDDIIIADGFWADGLQSMPRAVSHCHGIWSHLTKEDVDAGKQPDMPYHHAAQVMFRKRWTDLKKPLTAVSNFIANQLKLQWGWDAYVINNGVDVNRFVPLGRIRSADSKMVVVHGVNDRTNVNKGWDHIQAVIDELGDRAMVVSLDELCKILGDVPKETALAQADIMVHPSGYEGNSMFVAESLSCGVPVVGYDVGFLWELRHNGRYGETAFMDYGYVLDRNERNALLTAEAVAVQVDPSLRELGLLQQKSANARWLAEKHLSLQTFTAEWRRYVYNLELRCAV